MMLWDCSWVQNNIINGKDYGAHAFELLRSYGIPPLVTTRLQSTHAPSPTTQRPTTPRSKTTKKTNKQIKQYSNNSYLIPTSHDR